ncbi:MAG: HIT family protein [Dysgonamonadaceae bacterium]|jgi:histidine triad (HIT) family protein|nr:HIT family protein [Dysgonamonadaceae bacterium]
MSSIFSKIIAGEIPSYQVASNRDYLAFLDINPVAQGHVLVVPKQETDYIFDLDDTALAGMMVFAKRVAKAMQQVIECKKIGVAVIGLEVPHAHIHLIPLTEEGDLSFEKPRKPFTPAEMADIAAAIAGAFRE